MEFRLLGPVEVLRRGRLLALGGLRERAVLAVLLSEANRPVSINRLIELVWGAEAPLTARHSVQAAVSVLRRQLESDDDKRIVAQRPGYLMRVAPGELDLDLFRGLCDSGRKALARGDTQAAVQHLRKAERLWRGPPLEDLGEYGLMANLRAGIAAQRDRVLEDRFEAELGVGNAQDLIDELETLVASYPTRERLIGQLMLAHYRCERPQESLRVFDQAHRALRELGETPGPALQRMQQAVLTHDVALLPQQCEERDRIPDQVSAQSADGSRHNIPARISTFIGRADDLTEVRRLLGATRLLTLTGVGGCGKTRLALEVAEQCVGQYPDGVWLADLGPLSGADAVTQEVARALGIRDVPGQSLTEAVVEHVSGRCLLLVLDNCEHLLEPCAKLAARMLATACGVRILTTSRQALRTDGETVYQVRPLTVSDSESELDVDTVLGYEAPALFIERAAGCAPGFRLRSGQADELAELCRRLDGLPLAVELAAARLPVLSIAGIIRRLDDRFRLLCDGSRTAPCRQQTLLATVEWSYDLLDQAERALFRRLAVFAGSFDLQAAERVCADRSLPSGDVLDLLGALVAKSLAVVLDGEDDAPRYRLLETIRQYGAARLTDSGEEQLVARRHTEWCLERTLFQRN